MATRKQSQKPKKPQEPKKPPQRRRNPGEVAQSEALLDDSTKRDIAGVFFIVAAIVVFLMAVMPEDEAMFTGFASKWMHLVFGIGCYILPLVLLAIGITFLYKFQRHRVPGRAAIGFTIMFIGLLGVFALFAPISTVAGPVPDMLFSEQLLQGYGGYIGSGIAWVGITVFGTVITAVILAGLIIIGALVVGFSISKTIEVIRSKKRLVMPERPFGSQSISESRSFARVRRAEDPMGYSEEDMYYLEEESEDPEFDPDQTAVFVPLNTEEPVRRRGRIEIADDVDSSMTRRLAPITVAGEYEEQEEDYGFEPPFIEEDELCELEETETELTAMTRPLSKKGKKTSKAKKAPAAKESKPIQMSLPTPQDGFVLPSMSLLNASKKAGKGKNHDNELQDTAERLQQTLEDFGIEAEVVDWIAGPTVTLFEVNLPAGVRVSRIIALNDDIALALAAPGVRIFAPVPGTNYVGIEVPNASRQTVLLSDVLNDAGDGPLQMAIGKDVEGHSIVSDLAKMPHLLIGGTTGSGKSVAINAMIMSILMRATPSEVRFIMIDPKRVEFTPYNGIPHLYVPVVTEPKEAASALAWGVAEMERRLKVFSKLGARNIGQYNAKVHAMRDESDAAVDGAEALDDLPEEMPYIVIIIDELADLMMNIGKEVEISISRIAQLARAAGIHLIVATQRPSTNVVTGLIKANITNRIAFNVASSIDSRVILDTPGAESLIGLGDLLLSKPELAKPQRIQGCFVSEDEINRVVDFVKAQSSPEYHNEILNVNTYSVGDTNPAGGSSGSRDPLIWEAAEMVVSAGMGSTSSIQRRLKVGYARAGRIMDQLEELGVVGAANGSKPREVYVDEIELETLKAFEENDDE